MEKGYYTNNDDEEPLKSFKLLIVEFIEKTILKIVFEKINKNMDIEEEIKNIINEMENIYFKMDNSSISLRELITFYLKEISIDNLYDYLYKTAIDLINDYNCYMFNINLVYDEFIDSSYFDEAMFDVLNDYSFSSVSSEMKTYRCKSKTSYLHKLDSNKMRKAILYYLNGINENLFNLENINDYDSLYIDKLYGKGKDKRLIF